MVKVDEYQRELVVVALGAVDFRLQDETHVPRVVKGRAIVPDGQVVNFLDVPRVFQRDGGKVRERFQQLQVPRIEPTRTNAVDQLDHAKAGVSKAHRNRHDGLRLGFGLFIDFGEEACVLGGIGHNHGFPMLRHPAGDALPHLDAHISQRL